MSNPFSEQQKLISFLMPCYGPAYQYFETSFRALSEQEYKNFEVIVVFDGPQKKAEKELNRVAKKYKIDVRYETIKHAGAPVARNKAFELSRGEIVSFMDPDIFVYPETIKMWMNTFEERPEINRVWGLYDIVNENGEVMFPIGQCPKDNNGNVWYPAFKYTNYCSGMFPMRREVFPGWDPELKSLQDWDMALSMLEKNDFRGEDWLYVEHHFFATPAPYNGGLSDDSHKNWIERTDQVRNKHNLPKSDIVVTSHGAPVHGMHVAEKLGADFLPMPSFKDHKYKMVYLLGFYMKEDPKYPGLVTRSHMQVFTNNKGKNVIHWIGTDVWDLRWHCSFEKIKELKKWFKDNNVIHLCEVDFIQDELKEVGIDAKIVPIPPAKLYEPIKLPKEFTVGVYLPGRELYNEAMVMDVVRSMPDVKFVFFGSDARKGQKGDNWEHIGYVDYDELLPTLSCNLRLTTHDGLPLTPVQFMTAGRNVVTNVPLKGAIKVKPNRNDIIKGLRQAQKEPPKESVSTYWIKEMDFDKYVKRMRGLL